MKPAAPQRDQQILRLLAARNPEGLRALLEDYGKDALTFLRLRFGAEVDASLRDEALQLAAIRAWGTAQGRHRPITQLRAWFVTVARNCMLDVLEQQRRHDHVSLHDLDDASLAEPERYDNERANLTVDVRREIGRMRGLQRDVLLADLIAGEKTPADELARRFDTSPSAIYVARTRGRRHLHSKLLRLGYERLTLPADEPETLGGVR